MARLVAYARHVMKGLAVAAGLMVSAWPGSASAATQVFDLDIACKDCGGLSSFGSITVTEIANSDLSVSVDLAPGIFFHRNQNRNQHALAFSLFGNPTVTISALSDARFSSNGVMAAGSRTAPPFGRFDYAIDFERGRNGPPSAPLNHLSFVIGGPTPLSLASLEPHNVNCSSCFAPGMYSVFFAVDISNTTARNTFTGNIGAEFVEPIPEPATWAMMLIGFFGLALVSRRRRPAIAT